MCISRKLSLKPYQLYLEDLILTTTSQYVYFIDYPGFSLFIYFSWTMIALKCCVSLCFACKHAKSLQSCLTLCDPMDYSQPGSSVYGHSPDKNTGVGCHALLQGIFPTQGLTPHLMSPALACGFSTTLTTGKPSLCSIMK